MIRQQEEIADKAELETLSQTILSDITSYSKYAKFLSEKKIREQWSDTTLRNAAMHVAKYPMLSDEIYSTYTYVLNKKVFPSMRSLQFGGLPIELSPNRIFNCAAVAVDSIYAFNETMFLLLGGSGVGVSVQEHHVEQLPELSGPKKRTRRYLIGDSIEGWSDAIKILMESYFLHKSEVLYDYRDIRRKGSLLVTSGGKAPGPQPLKDCIHNIKKILDRAIELRGVGCQITTLETHDIMCFIANAVLAGGIRRAALISLFSFGDNDMMTCKTFDKLELNPQRHRANNSVVLVRHKIRKKDFMGIWKIVEASKAGEPGVFFTNDKNLLCNPCCEISLKSMGFCNLTTINVSDCDTQEELNERVRAAAFIGTLQASYTDFHYLRSQWKTNAEKESLLGVSMTGIGSGAVLKLNLEEAATIAVEENKRVAELIGINPALRVTCIKPEGTASLVAGTSSGIHAWHAPYYIRRMRLGKDEAIYQYLKDVIPELIEDEYFDPEKLAILSIPVKAPKGAIYRTESPIDLLNRVKKFHDEWIKPGHIKGSNTHNVSVTVSIQDHEWKEVGDWMWTNRDSYNGISVIPYDGGSYKQAPFEEIGITRYNTMLSYVHNIDLTQVKEEEDTTNHSGEAVCSGGACEVSKL